MLSIITFHFMYLILVLMLLVPSGYAFSKLEDDGSFTDLFVGLLSAMSIGIGVLLVLTYLNSILFGGS